MDYGFDRDTVVVPGAGSGIGRVTALLAASLGLRVSAWDLNATAVADVVAQIVDMGTDAMAGMADKFERYLGDAARGQNVGKSPEVNAPAVVFLLSDAAAGINGQVVRIDGDELSIMIRRSSSRPRTIPSGRSRR
jgi:NAD(P)-dependent dehydrogenase (short-subunit alcohol dehydrogenase family)